MSGCSADCPAPHALGAKSAAKEIWLATGALPGCRQSVPSQVLCWMPSRSILQPGVREMQTGKVIELCVQTFALKEVGWLPLGSDSRERLRPDGQYRCEHCEQWQL